jgi:hypothetical protein
MPFGVWRQQTRFPGFFLQSDSEPRLTLSLTVKARVPYLKAALRFLTGRPLGPARWEGGEARPTQPGEAWTPAGKIAGSAFDPNLIPASFTPKPSQT